MLRLSLMLLTVMAGAQTAGADVGAPGAMASTESAGPAGPSTASRREKRTAKRRGKRAGRMAGWPVPEKQLLTSPPAPPSGKLRIYSLNYKDEVDVNIYNPDGSFDVQ